MTIQSVKTLELFAGSCSFTDIAKEYGFITKTLDSGKDLITDEHYSKIDYVGDLLVWDYKNINFKPDIIWASVPCTTFSIASCSKHWNAPDGNGLRYPKSEEAVKGLKLLEKTIEIINYFNPKYYIIENPRGLMRKMLLMQPLNRKTVTYCQYGDNRMKPTDIWTNIDWTPRPMCKNGDSCHESAPRGSRTGTQGIKNPYNRSKVPPDLIKEIIDATIS